MVSSRYHELSRAHLILSFHGNAYYSSVLRGCSVVDVATGSPGRITVLLDPMGEDDSSAVGDRTHSCVVVDDHHLVVDNQPSSPIPFWVEGNASGGHRSASVVSRRFAAWPLSSAEIITKLKVTC